MSSLGGPPQKKPSGGSSLGGPPPQKKAAGGSSLGGPPPQKKPETNSNSNENINSSTQISEVSTSSVQTTSIGGSSLGAPSKKNVPKKKQNEKIKNEENKNEINENKIEENNNNNNNNNEKSSKDENQQIEQLNEQIKTIEISKEEEKKEENLSTQKKEEEKEKEKEKENEDEEDDEEDSSTSTTSDNKQLTAAQKKKLKKKEKEKAKKAEKQTENETIPTENEQQQTSGNKKKGAKETNVKKPSATSKLAEKILKQREEEERLRKEEEERLRKEEEERIRLEEEEKRKQEELLEKKKQKKENRKQKQKINAQLEAEKKLAAKREQMVKMMSVSRPSLSKEELEQKKHERKEKIQKLQNDENDDENGDEEEEDWEALLSSDDEDEKKKNQKKDEKKEKKNEENEEENENDDDEEEEELSSKNSKSNEKNIRKKREELRAPVCCVLGHVDTGKTSLLDKIRHTNVQEGEAGGITQQIGATFFPLETLKEKTIELQDKITLGYKIPGLLVIDTPGHESFTNLRQRGTSLCDIAILVVDLMHSLEPQTIESIHLLRTRKTPFIVALNKVDRLYQWKVCPNSPIQKAFEQQQKNVMDEFHKRTKEVITAFAGQGLNACLYFDNTDYRHFVSLVPTSAVSGEGIPDLLMLLVQLTQRNMMERFLYSPTELKCTVMEVKSIEGLGITIDVILTNGRLKEGETIVVCGLNGPIVTTIRALLTPQPLREMRVKTPYIHHKVIKAAQGIKVVAQGLETALSGSQLLVPSKDDDIEDLKEEVMEDLNSILAKQMTNSDGQGVFVQASTLGSLEALLDFLMEKAKIPVAGVNIGPVHKKDVMRASVMLEKDPTYACILAFDIKTEKEAQEYADQTGVKIFSADIIYHLEQKFTKYMEDVLAEKQKAAAGEAVFPCCLKIHADSVFNKRDPLIFGVRVVEGNLRLQTPICVPSKGFILLGRVVSIEENHKTLDVAEKGSDVAIKIDTPLTKYMYGRHFDHKDNLYSKISRSSIDCLKNTFGESITKDDRLLIQKYKSIFGIL